MLIKKNIENEKQPLKLPAQIWILGFVSLLMDVSSEIVHGLLPVFLVSSLGASYSLVGVIEGAGEATAMAVKVFSGPLSDWLGKRKPLVLFGYALGALCKPLFAIATYPSMVFGARIFDRIGKGVRSAPRDALIADITHASIRGRAFGLRQSLDTVGAFIGPLLAIYLMSIFANNYRQVFWIAAIPGGLAAILILIGIKEPKTKLEKAKNIFSSSHLRVLGSRFWLVVLFGSVLQVARMSEAFLILRAQSVGVALSAAPIVLVVMNLVYSLAAYPAGWLSDNLKRERLLEIGMVFLILSNLCLGYGSSIGIVFVGIALWGLHLGFTQGILTALVADHCPSELIGTGFGIFNLAGAISLLIANTLAGAAWDFAGPQLTFAISGIIAASFLGTLLFKKRPL